MKRGQRRRFRAVCVFGALCLTLDVNAQKNAQACLAEATRDRIEMHRDSDRLVVDVYRVKGIGHAEISAPTQGWPPAVVVRLQGFPELESFTAMSKTAKLECALTRPEGRQPVQACWLGSAAIDALRREADYFAIDLPRTLLAPGGGPIAVEWVDQWR
jgi:hypothetical protein